MGSYASLSVCLSVLCLYSVLWTGPKMGENNSYLQEYSSQQNYASVSVVGQKFALENNQRYFFCRGITKPQSIKKFYRTKVHHQTSSLSK